MATTEPSLRVSAHVLVQLGSELVTDVEQALLECVKNAYDADSIGCTIEIDTRETGEILDRAEAAKLMGFTKPAENVIVTLYKGEERLDPGLVTVAERDIVERHLNYTGRVTIEDRGTGITPDQILGSWLVISGSAKRAQGTGPKEKTKGGRTPLGDKGLGRLGSMKLGDILLVESATHESQPVAIARFRWADCTSVATVDEVPVFTEVRQNVTGLKGTRVSVLGLSDMPEWRRKGRIFEITQSLARLISPFEATSTFPVSITLDGVQNSLVSVTNEILRQAVAKFTFDWTRDEKGNGILIARAHLKKRLFTSSRSGVAKHRTETVFHNDDDSEFLKFLGTYSRTRGYSIEREGEWYVVLQKQSTWTDMLLDNGTLIEDPGPFHGAFYYFNLDQRDAPDEAAASGFGVTTKTIKDAAGIAVLRDGFRVRSPGDWLGIAQGMTSGSFYNLRDNNTIGYFALTGEKNYRLVEKSDREGFIEDAAFRGFFQIALSCKEFANAALENTRRALDALYKERLKKIEGQGSTPPAEPLGVVEASIAAARNAQETAQRSAKQLAEALSHLEKDGAGSPIAATAAMKIARDAVTSMSALGESLSRRPDAFAALRRAEAEKESVSEQSMALFESAAVGLSARGLAHELRTHITEIRQKMSAILNLAKKGNATEQKLSDHIRAVRAACSAIASSAALIDPLLPRTRNLKDRFSVRQFVDEYMSTRAHVFERENISFEVVGSDLTVRINRARLLQVLDNLVRNSVYWLNRGCVSGELVRPKAIRIEITATGFNVADSGPGVKRDIEDSIFELFVTGKPAGDPGQGLGLFIIRQLLIADGCDIALAAERNPEGRRFRFNVDLSAVVVR